ncbi:MAG: LptE family protein [Methylacidiphilales bacterium]|nr:LptE family protein [Candidatus Methylacidiphilales bacterium]
MKFARTLQSQLLLIPLLILTGCAGYHVGNIASSDLKGVKTIYVPMVKNETYEPSIQAIVTNAIIHSMENDGTFHSTRMGSADATLEVTITQFDRNPTLFSRDNTIVPLEYRGTMTARVTLLNNLTGKKILADTQVSGYTDYFTSQSSQQRDAVEAERQALPLAAQKLADNIVKQVTDGW